MKFWVLVIYMMTGQTEYGYKFMEKKNCEKIGKNITSTIKKTSFKCKERSI